MNSSFPNEPLKPLSQLSPSPVILDTVIFSSLFNFWLFIPFVDINSELYNLYSELVIIFKILSK